MLRFRAERYFRVMAGIGQLEGAVRLALQLNSPAVSKQMADVLAIGEGGTVNIGDLRECVEELDLRLSAAHLDRMTAAVENRRATIAEFMTMLHELRQRIIDELAADVLFRLPRDLGGYFEETRFSEAVFVAFPSAVTDVEEAARCLALSRNTACVLHLMRAVEPVIHALAARLNVPYEYRGWEPVIRKMRSELEKSYDTMDPTLKGKKEFFSNALDRLTGLKDALRNPTMHGRLHYDATRAYDVYRAVRTFMETCAAELVEQPDVPQGDTNSQT